MLFVSSKFERTPDLTITITLLKAIIVQALLDLHGEVCLQIICITFTVVTNTVWCLNSSGSNRIQGADKEVLLLCHQDTSKVERFDFIDIICYILQ